VLLVSERAHLVYRPALPWLLLGQRCLEDLLVALPARMARHGVEFLQDRVEGFDRARGAVRLSRGGWLTYDYLVVATGAAPYLPWPGSSRAVPFLWPDQVLEARRQLDGLTSARPSVAVVIAPGCPVPCGGYEVAFLLDDELRRRGMRHRTDIHVVTGEQRPLEWMGPFAVEVVSRWAERCSIHLHTGQHPASMDSAGLRLAGGTHVPADLILLFPRYRGPACLAGLDGLLDTEGFVVVTDSMRSAADDRVFAVGDVISRTGPKTGFMAEMQGKVAARALADTALGRPTQASFDSRLLCLMDGGGRRRGLGVLRRPGPPAEDPHTLVAFSGLLPRLLKQAFERFYVRFGV
ncbi:MAG TPA: FAD-dependent oxidoreductase, partial [Limnochordales bacterium]